MCPANDNTASCEIRALICFLHAKSMSAAQIPREIRAVYDQNIMSEGTVTKCCRMFRVGRTNVHNDERSFRSSVMGDDLFQSDD
jgi:hypothetical protein